MDSLVSFIAKLLRLCRPYRRRLALGVLMGVLGGLLEPMLFLCVKFAVDVAFPGANIVSSGSPTFSQESINDLPAMTARLQAQDAGGWETLWRLFSPATQERIAAFSPTNSTPKWLSETLVPELN